MKEDILNVFKLENDDIYFTKKLQTFAANSVLKWRKIIEDWVILGDIIVVHFEDLVDDKMSDVSKMIEYLKVEPDE